VSFFLKNEFVKCVDFGDYYVMAFGKFDKLGSVYKIGCFMFKKHIFHIHKKNLTLPLLNLTNLPNSTNSPNLP
jgi:hypothetical protein